ncbi:MULTISPECIES: hypothetical protein [Pseudomonas]|uniref:Uncharacterized protein n=5 Tax=Pseudomonas syringae group genomosp. 2 TaxID=251698 RepID=A0A0N8T0R4_PSEAJ|nr:MULTISPECIES: hypothetical protein [Pseudomonas syringae group]KPB13146.1 Uncharacterized protein AC516_0817 [Pseudomonas amygdali pv. sesami]KPC02567.1 Uncharacterized protein AC501_0553 [Pseudomonas amygdali pv. lachrymans]KPC22923.1 Uncharacterized protein AC499_6773 [Pseudomonas amygdali pv. lachrymans]KPX57744.1 Uncharacterized protein ALO67_02977 [Pseudomonas amygdali pv. hibisci]KPX70270.1 Uncharacterized protein ALO35_02867 [Pseudomonas amygdali pv. lachrymans]
MMPDRHKLFGKTVNSSRLFWLAALAFLIAASIDFQWHYIGLAGMFTALAATARRRQET